MQQQVCRGERQLLADHGAVPVSRGARPSRRGSATAPLARSACHWQHARRPPADALLVVLAALHHDELCIRLRRQRRHKPLHERLNRCMRSVRLWAHRGSTQRGVLHRFACLPGTLHGCCDATRQARAAARMLLMHGSGARSAHQLQSHAVVVRGLAVDCCWAACVGGCATPAVAKIQTRSS